MEKMEPDNKTEYSKFTESSSEISIEEINQLKKATQKTNRQTAKATTEAIDNNKSSINYSFLPFLSLASRFSK
jgi:hypothetical protein